MSFPRRRSNRATPNIVLTLAPWNKQEIIELYCHPKTIRQMADDVLNAKIGEYCGLIHGNVVEWGEECGTYGLLDATALFRGIKRPMEWPGIDETVYTYITNPRYSYTYPQDTRPARIKEMGEEPIGLTPVEKPRNAVFATYVDMTNDLEKHGINREKLKIGYDIKGVVLYWEWVRSSPQAPSLPEGSNSRYGQPVW